MHTNYNRGLYDIRKCVKFEYNLLLRLVLSAAKQLINQKFSKLAN